MLEYYILYRLIRALSTPYTSWPAYEAGVINDKGDIITPAKFRTSRQNGAFSKTDLIALKFRRQFAKSGSSINPLMTTTAALMLIKEGNEISDETIEYISEAIIFHLNENEGGGGEGAPATNTGNIDGYQNAKGITPAMRFSRKPKREEHPFKQ